MLTAAQLERYTREREELLAQAFLHHRRSYDYPADALEDVLAWLGYTIEFRGGVPEGVMAFCDFETQRVVVADDLEGRLAFPKSAPGVLRSCLAHELGHIRLHAAQRRKGVLRKCWEEQAHNFAMVFLMPRHAVMARPQVRILQRGWVREQEEIWNLVADLGQEFRVNGSFMARALVAYGVIKMNRRTRVMRCCVLAPEGVQCLAA